MMLGWRGQYGFDWKRRTIDNLLRRRCLLGVFLEAIPKSFRRRARKIAAGAPSSEGWQP
jgi:hypothetical protein